MVKRSNVKGQALLLLLLLVSGLAHSQAVPAGVPASVEAAAFDFVSDTQQPLGVEKIRLKATQNTRATAMIFGELLKKKPAALFMLGDVVALGYSNKKWRSVDRFLDSARKEDIRVYGVLGNHDVLGRDKKGEANFRKRFPEQRRTGYFETIDSVAVILLNSNFSKLSQADADKEQKWYEHTLDSLNRAPGIRAVIVTCHHPAYTNSDIVNPSPGVRSRFIPAFQASAKTVLFITGHSHNFEHFEVQDKNFLVIGGGGGLHQPITVKAGMPEDKAHAYKPLFHYLQLKRYGNLIDVSSFEVRPDFSGFDKGYSFQVKMP